VKEPSFPQSGTSSTGQKNVSFQHAVAHDRFKIAEINTRPCAKRFHATIAMKAMGKNLLFIVPEETYNRCRQICENMNDKKRSYPFSNYYKVKDSYLL
jgi:hypothetical protein